MPETRGKAVLIAPTLVALWFLNSYAFPYLAVERDRYGIYWARRDWLFVHIVTGMAALLLGPLQLWLGANRRATVLHRMLGGAYAGGVFISGGAALYLARHTDFGWVFGIGLSAMAIAWIVATSLAIIAILLHMNDQHREWMIRSYVLTFGFVTFRAFTQTVQVAGLGTTIQQMTAASWFSWAVPLLITEWVLQGMKIVKALETEKGRTPKMLECVPVISEDQPQGELDEPWIDRGGSDHAQQRRIASVE